jgi:hypothetical protein
MEYSLYKPKRDEMIKFLFNTGNTVGQISGRLAIDEDLVRSVIRTMKPKHREFVVYAYKNKR